MLITSYDYAHSMVEKSKSLSWNGWDIVELKENPAAEYKPNGVLINGTWHYSNVFPLTESGWEVPNKYARS